MNEHASPVTDGVELAELFHRVARLMARRGCGGPHGRHAQARVLRLLRERGPMRQGELLEMLDVRSASLSELLAKLERNGRIARERDDRDRRGFVVRVIDNPAETGGFDAPGEPDESNESNESGMVAGGSEDPGCSSFAGLDEDERAQLRGLLLKLAATLEADPLRAGPRGGHGRRHGDGPRGLGPGRGHGCGHGRHGGRGGADL